MKLFNLKFILILILEILYNQFLNRIHLLVLIVQNIYSLEIDYSANNHIRRTNPSNSKYLKYNLHMLTN